MTFIPYGRQDINAEDIDAVVSVLRSDWLTQGPACEKFEDTVRDYCGVSHALATNSATSALHLACLALGLGPGDSMWTSPITFVASANAALYCGAKVDFVDIDEAKCNMSVAALEEKLAHAGKNGGLPKVVMPVHFAGQSCDMSAIAELAKKYGFAIIEDASHAIGGRYGNRPVGCCEYSSVAVFSFHPVKIVTTGEGGMAVTNDAKLADRMRLLRSHGITRDPGQMRSAPPGGWYYEQLDLGFNYRMTDIQAALGTSQMRRIDEMVRRRQSLSSRYREKLAHLPVTLLGQHPDAYSACHLYVVRVDRSRTRVSRETVFARMRASNIGVNVHYIPVYAQPYYRELGFRSGGFPAAERYYQEAISLPLFPALGEESQDFVIQTLADSLS